MIILQKYVRLKNVQLGNVNSYTLLGSQLHFKKSIRSLMKQKKR